MIDSVPTTVLQNCTIAILYRFPNLTEYNETDIRIFERNDVEDALSDIIQKYHTIYTDTRLQNSFTESVKDCLFSALNQKPFELPWLQKFFWFVTFFAMLFVAISGNVIVLWIVIAHRRMRTVTNYFLVNLSLSDLLMATMNCVFNFIFMIDSDWPFGYIYCIINNFIANLSVAASVFTLVAISFDRYIAIVKPLHHRSSRIRAKIFLSLIWSTSCVLAAPCLFYSKISTKSYSKGKTRTVCYLEWPDGQFPVSRADYIYNIVFLILTYAIPIAIMIFCYSLMGRELWGSRSIGEHTERQLESMRSKRKVVRMFVVIVTIFAVCWLPYHLFFIYSYYNTSMVSTSYAQHLYLGFYFLAMANASVNPLIYYYMNERFRIYFQQAICCLCRFKPWKSNRKAGSPQGGILLGKHSHSEMMQAKSPRQKTLSVKWHQSMSETKLHHVSSRKNMDIASVRNRSQTQKLSDSHECVSRQESLVTATTPLMVTNSNINAVNSSDDIKCDCIAPQDCITNIKFQMNGHDDTTTHDVFAVKSEGC
ncbi:hypothetical protein PVAND_002886 [Polypedilum vanderplanki]|uniref:G-protein coupled receptors family 1 profile domain-containing protein n=1 Tax=Polypedilum vanderplanki TaxID=319348 RepID=A0A9J6BSW4_POLVA|nr:hypothetical protein PVAND_002886 [Polypedilum vanderplanki]